eukprot:2154654-Prymnesium_polylepis.1
MPAAVSDAQLIAALTFTSDEERHVPPQLEDRIFRVIAHRVIRVCALRREARLLNQAVVVGACACMWWCAVTASTWCARAVTASSLERARQDQEPKARGQDRSTRERW